MTTTDYRVSLQPTSAGMFTPNQNCVFFRVTGKAMAGFNIELRNCNSGALVPATGSVVLDYIAIVSR